MTYSIGLLAPTLLTEQLGVRPSDLGAYLVLPPLCNVSGALMSASCATALHRRGVSALRLQKCMTGTGGVIGSACALLLIMSRSPSGMVACWCGVVLGHCFHDHGYDSNKSTVGGEDAAVIESVCNPVANVPGLMSPVLASFFLHRAGTRMPLFAVAAVLQLSGSAIFCQWASGEIARVTVARRNARSNQRPNR
jgi:hypothetical protein